MELRGYGSIAKRWWFALLLAAWGGALLGYVVTLVLPPTYEARSQLLVGPIDAGFTIQRASGNLARTFADLATSQDLLTSIADDIPGLDREALEDSISTTASEATRLVSITLQQPDPALAAEATNAIVARLIELTGSPNPEGQITVIDVAAVPEEPIGPSLPLVVGMSAAAGLVGAVLLLYLFESTSGVVRGRDAAAELTGAPVLASLRRVGTLSAADAGSGSLMLLSAHVRAGGQGQPSRMVILGTSPTDDSSAWAAVQLAAEFAAADNPVALVDAGDGAATRLLAGPRGSAVGSLRGPADVELGDGSVITLFPAGPGRPIPDSPTFADGMEGGTLIVCAESFESGAARSWIAAVGSAVAVVTRDRTRRDDLEQTASALSLMGAELAGIVLVEPAGRFAGRFGRGRREDRSTRAATTEEPRPRTEP